MTVCIMSHIVCVKAHNIIFHFYELTLLVTDVTSLVIVLFVCFITVCVHCMCAVYVCANHVVMEYYIVIVKRRANLLINHVHGWYVM